MERDYRVVSHRAGGYRFETNEDKPAVVGWISEHRDRLGNVLGWKWHPNTCSRASSRKNWPTPEAAIAATKLVKEKWAREQIAAVGAGEA
jgi:hypothetical protein